MSLTASLRPTNFPFSSALPVGVRGQASNEQSSSIPFRHDSNYLALTRMLTRYQNLILLIPAPPNPFNTNDPRNDNDLTPLQRQVQAELYSPLPYHRNKWLHNVQAARNLLLQLERQSQEIKVQRTKRDVQKDLTDKRNVIKRLRNSIEEIGREVEGMGEQAWTRNTARSLSINDDDLLGERADDILANMSGSRTKKSPTGQNEDLQEGKPITNISQETQLEPTSASNNKGKVDNDNIDKNNDDKTQRDALFESSIRRRGNQPASSTTDTKNPPPSSPTSTKAYTSGFTDLKDTERRLDQSARTHEDLTTSLIDMAAQLKQQTRAFQFSLDQDKTLLDRALEGLDKNVSAMDLASRNMAFLTRMSEGEGFFGRLKLYAIIVGMWVFAVMLVFVGPKLRF